MRVIVWQLPMPTTRVALMQRCWTLSRALRHRVRGVGHTFGLWGISPLLTFVCARRPGLTSNVSRPHWRWEAARRMTVMQRARRHSFKWALHIKPTSRPWLALGACLAAVSMITAGSMVRPHGSRLTLPAGVLLKASQASAQTHPAHAWAPPLRPTARRRPQRAGAMVSLRAPPLDPQPGATPPLAAGILPRTATITTSAIYRRPSAWRGGGVARQWRSIAHTYWARALQHSSAPMAQRSGQER